MVCAWNSIRWAWHFDNFTDRCSWTENRVRFIRRWDMPLRRLLEVDTLFKWWLTGLQISNRDIPNGNTSTSVMFHLVAIMWVTPCQQTADCLWINRKLVSERSAIVSQLSVDYIDVNVFCLYSDIPFSSADLTIFIPCIGTLTCTVDSSPCQEFKQGMKVINIIHAYR